jgi:hypothetical protein
VVAHDAARQVIGGGACARIANLYNIKVSFPICRDRPITSVDLFAVQRFRPCGHLHRLAEQFRLISNRAAAMNGYLVWRRE